MTADLTIRQPWSSLIAFGVKTDDLDDDEPSDLWREVPRD